MKVNNRSKVALVSASALGLLLTLSFQNCAPQRFESLESSIAQGGTGIGGGGGSQDSDGSGANNGSNYNPPGNPGRTPGSSESAGNSGGSSSGSSNSGTTSNSGSSSSAGGGGGSSGGQSAEPDLKLYVQNNYLTAESFKIEMKTTSTPAFSSVFPESRVMGGTMGYIYSDALVIAGESSLANSAADVCISTSSTGCTNASQFRKANFSAVNSKTNLVYFTAENYWATSTMKHFGDYYVFVKAKGITKKALVKHRVHLVIGEPIAGYFVSSTTGDNNYEFTCETPKSSDIGWMTYANYLGSLKDSSKISYKTCYYRVLTDFQVEEIRKAKYANQTPSITISCPATAKAGISLSCIVTSWTSYSMQGASTWKWFVDGQEVFTAEKFVAPKPDPGVYKVQLIGVSNAGVAVKSNIQTITITP